MTKKTYTVEVIANRKTGLLVGLCNELPGLFVHGRDEAELDERLPLAIKALLEANGEQVGEIVEVEERVPSSFSNPVRHFERELEAA